MAGQVRTELGNGVPVAAAEVLLVLQEPAGKSFAASLHWATLVPTEFPQKEREAFSF